MFWTQGVEFGFRCTLLKSDRYSRDHLLAIYWVFQERAKSVGLAPLGFEGSLRAMYNK